MKVLLLTVKVVIIKVDVTMNDISQEDLELAEFHEELVQEGLLKRTNPEDFIPNMAEWDDPFAD